MNKLSRIIERLGAGALFVAVILLFGSAKEASALTLTSSGSGYVNGYYYGLYLSGGSAIMTISSGGNNYSCGWSDAGDVVAGVGWNPGSSQTLYYNCGSYSNSSSGSQGVYGWTTSPLVEYYIMDNTTGNQSSGSFIGTVSSDGATYNVWHHQQVNQPSIIGTATFWQDVSIRNGNRGTGANVAITLSNHFNYWNSHGMTLGTFNLQDISCESYGGGGGYVNQTVWH